MSKMPTCPVPHTSAPKDKSLSQGIMNDDALIHEHPTTTCAFSKSTFTVKANSPTSKSETPHKLHAAAGIEPPSPSRHSAQQSQAPCKNDGFSASTAEVTPRSRTAARLTACGGCLTHRTSLVCSTACTDQSTQVATSGGYL